MTHTTTSHSNSRSGTRRPQRTRQKNDDPDQRHSHRHRHPRHRRQTPRSFTQHPILLCTTKVDANPSFTHHSFPPYTHLNTSGWTTTTSFTGLHPQTSRRDYSAETYVVHAHALLRRRLQIHVRLPLWSSPTRRPYDRIRLPPRPIQVYEVSCRYRVDGDAYHRVYGRGRLEL